MKNTNQGCRDMSWSGSAILVIFPDITLRQQITLWCKELASNQVEYIINQRGSRGVVLGITSLMGGLELEVAETV